MIEKNDENNKSKALSLHGIGRGRFLLGILMAVCCRLFVCGGHVTEAGEQLYFDTWGNLRMTTYDRIATSNKTYKTVGWVMKRYDRSAGEGNETVVLQLEDDGAPVPDASNQAYQYCSFWCDKQTIFDKIGEVSEEWQRELYQNGGNVYLDAVMTVCVRGVPQGGLLQAGEVSWGRVYDTFEGIAGAENWADKTTLQSHFGKQVYFQGNPAMLEPSCVCHIKYYEAVENGEVWPMSRFLKDRSGQLALGESLRLQKNSFSGYYYVFDSVRIRTRNVHGTDREVWSHAEDYQFVFSDETLVAVTMDVFYRRVEQTEVRTDIFQLNEGQVVMDATAGILAGSMSGKNFSTDSGVPSGEELCVYGSLNAFGYQLEYKRHYGIKTQPVTVETRYQCQWTDAFGVVQTRQVTDTENYYVDRPYSYWTIEGADIRILDSLKILNYAFDGEEVVLETSYSPDITLETGRVHLWMKGATVFQRDGGVLYGEPGSVTFPKGYGQLTANEQTGSYTVQNDTFSIDGEVFLAGNEVTAYAGNPKTGSVGRKISFYKDKLVIPETKQNGYHYESLGIARYRRYGTENVQEQTIPYVNPVTIHTPVVCRGFVTDERQYNQLCKPDGEKKTLILGREFEVAISTYGQHDEKLGYGCRDYGKYTKACQIKLPFEVYYGDTYYKADVWIDYKADEKFYLPTGVREGAGTITVRTLATNYMEEEEALMGLRWNEYMDQYAAYDTMEVVVCGRLYGMKITDISGAGWKDVFYDKAGNLKGYGYFAGLHNENGSLVRTNHLATFPILQGGNPLDAEKEAEAPGTTYSYELMTIGNYAVSEGIYIEPRFFVVDEQNGKNRQEVDVYHFAGEDKKILELVTSQEESGRRYLREESRTDMGCTDRNVSDADAAGSSVQKWKGEFTLPQNILVVPKDFEIRRCLAQMGYLDMVDSLFIKSGYLVVQFDIYSVKNHRNYLSYRNEENISSGYACMWKLEGAVSPKKRADGSEFMVEEGDVFLYNLSEIGKSSHKIVGTH